MGWGTMAHNERCGSLGRNSRPGWAGLLPRFVSPNGGCIGLISNSVWSILLAHRVCGLLTILLASISLMEAYHISMFVLSAKKSIPVVLVPYIETKKVFFFTCQISQQILVYALLNFITTLQVRGEPALPVEKKVTKAK